MSAASRGIRLGGAVLVALALWLPTGAEAGKIRIRGEVLVTAPSPIDPRSAFFTPLPDIEVGDPISGTIEFADGAIAAVGPGQLDLSSGLIGVDFTVGDLTFDENSGQLLAGLDGFGPLLTTLDGEPQRFLFDGVFRLDDEGQVIRRLLEAGDLFFVIDGDPERGHFVLFVETTESEFPSVVEGTFRLVPEPLSLGWIGLILVFARCRRRRAG